MKVSLNWVKEFTEVELPVDELAKKIGAQLGAVETVEDLGQKYEGIVVIEVLSCEKHPDADKLSVCIVDDRGAVSGIERQSDGHVQIVCGAPNVKVGMKAAWIPPGVVVPSTAVKDPFKIEAKDIRGVISNGMLASPKELDLGESHDGLLELDSDTEPGQAFAKANGLDDVIIDIENKMFTHRPDCFGMLGVARELAGIEARSFKSPHWYRQDSPTPPTKATTLKLVLNNEIPKQVPRFCLLSISDVKVEPSSAWLQARLTSVGVRPINNIVDITNYFMLETGQPLHAYDYDKLGTGRIDVRLSKEGEKLKLIGGKDLKIHTGSVVITDGKKPIGLGGVMGGAETEVDESTKNIVLECGNFEMNATRRSAMAHGLFTDAATRFTKGQSPLQNLAVINKAAEEIIKVAGGGVGGEFLDKHTDLPTPSKINVSTTYINERLGLNLKAEQIEKILENVELKVARQKDELEITSPFWRTDIGIAEDIVEEVGRLYGYDHLPMELPKKDLSPAKLDALLGFKAKLRNILSSGGANEVLTYSFVHGSLLQKVGQNPDVAYQLRNALSPDLQYYRLSVMPSVLEKVHPNIKLGHQQLALFELGKSHNKLHPEDGHEKVPKEFNMLALVTAFTDKITSKDSGAVFYQAKAYLDFLGLKLGITFKYEALDSEPDFPVAKPYDHQRSAAVSVAETGTGVGMIGEFRPEVSAGLKLPKFCAGFEIGVEELLAGLPKDSIYRALPKFPKVQQDITLRVASKVAYGDLFNAFSESLDVLKPENSFTELLPLGIYSKSDDQKNITWRLNIANYDKTMKAEEVNSLLDAVAAKLKTKFGAERV